MLEASFPTGALNPTSILVERESTPASEHDVAAVRERVQDVGGIAAIRPAQHSEDGAIAKIDLTSPTIPSAWRWSERGRDGPQRDSSAECPFRLDAVVCADAHQTPARDDLRERRPARHGTTAIPGAMQA